MIFHRSLPPRPYGNYLRYRPLLRQDFQNRCAYCLLHEYYLGGESGCCIDHHRPVRGPSGRSDLVATYSNLYWCCRECNENKGDTWPSNDDYNSGLRFLDPCQPEDDHNSHWRVREDGSLEAISRTGLYTIERLKLWRPFLQHHRARMYRLLEEARSLERLLGTKRMTDSQRNTVRRRLSEIRDWLEPPVFARSR